MLRPEDTGGTYAHKDIAFEFCSAISPVFKLLLNVSTLQRGNAASDASASRHEGVGNEYT